MCLTFIFLVLRLKSKLSGSFVNFSNLRIFTQKGLQTLSRDFRHKKFDRALIFANKNHNYDYVHNNFAVQLKIPSVGSGL